MTLPHPPAGWPQRAGRILPFPPGNGSDEWELVMDREPGEAEWSRYHLRNTGEVYLQRTDGRFVQPTWGGLPLAVRRRVWAIAEGR